MHKLDLDRLDLIVTASVTVKKQRQFVSLLPGFQLLVFFVFSSFSSFNLQVKMAAEEKWKTSAEQEGEKEPCVLLGQQLGEPGRFAYAALCGISLAQLFPEKEQRYDTGWQRVSKGGGFWVAAQAEPVSDCMGSSEGQGEEGPFEIKCFLKCTDFFILWI